MPYAELHCHSYYSFHDGASSLEELMLRAKDLGYRALAVTDHDNLCGAMRFAPPPGLLPEPAAALIALSGCPRGELSQLVVKSRFAGAKSLVKQYLDWFGQDNYYIELQRNLAFGDTARNISLLKLAQETGAKVVATGNVHYHIRERHRLQDCLVAVRNCQSLEETHRERRANSEYYLRPTEELDSLFRDCPEALT